MLGSSLVSRKSSSILWGSRKRQMPDLDEQLKLLIEQYGAAEVRRRVGKLTGATKRSIRKNAVQYVTEMSIPAVHKEKLLSLARLFEEGRFLPNTADIRNLFGAFGTNPGQLKARQAAVPMVFRFLASCSTERLDRILAEGLFAGPAELGPIAEAIRATSA